MIAFPISLIALPLMILLWTVDACAFAVAARILLVRLNSTRHARATLALREIVDPLADVLRHRLCRIRHRPVTDQALWAILLASLLIARYAIVFILARSVS